MSTLNDLAWFGYLKTGYLPMDQAADSGDSTIFYYGFEHPDESYYILKRDTTAGANSLQTFRYSESTSGYSTAWANRESLTYGGVNATFGA
jgi:hypothetical protein